jgi:hypothetical protein
MYSFCGFELVLIWVWAFSTPIDLLSINDNPSSTFGPCLGADFASKIKQGRAVEREKDREKRRKNLNKNEQGCTFASF